MDTIPSSKIRNDDFRAIADEARGLVTDGASPFSVLYPELRLSQPVARKYDAAQVLGVLFELVDVSDLRAWLVTPNGKTGPIRRRDIDEIASEYESGIRPNDFVSQILDRADIWFELTGTGRFHRAAG